MNKLRSSKNFNAFGRFSSTSTLKRIGKEFGLEQLKEVISNDQLLQTANSPMQVIPFFYMISFNYLSSIFSLKIYLTLG